MDDDDDVDFRSERMASPDGYGFARRLWEEYRKVSNRLLGPAVAPLAKVYAAGQVTDLFGFWLVWQVEGGFDGLTRIGMTRSSIYRRIRAFRKMTGMHPDEYVLPGVDFDLETYRTTKPYRRTASPEDGTS